ncbi:DUF1631 domain-containing protein [Luteimonas sp. Y-2-2-4F]|nr:DUF1631 family protein [Luteimonas sp. Y-2-2-4F]MCD9033677.1 DUF1631 domain-containing protein [Luteimonas sp. Y-2-2-4F]
MGPDGRAEMAPAQCLDALRRGAAVRMAPLLLEAMTSLRRELDAAVQQEPTPPGLPEDRADLLVLIRHAAAHERRWLAYFAAAFDGWPQAAERADAGAFSLVSDDELQSQLIGEPAIAALERRCADVLDTIDRRLHSLAARLGGAGPPRNPLGPRNAVSSLLRAVSPHDCNPRLRAALLRHYERRAGERLGEVYAWCNAQLAAAGYALSSGSEAEALLGAHVPVAGRSAVWSEGNALPPRASTWRAAPVPAAPQAAAEAARGRALRERLRRAPATADAGARALREEELQALLSLLQAEPDALGRAHRGAGTARALREGLREAGERIGIQRDSARPAQAQDDAIELVGRLFDALAGDHLLSAAAHERLAALALPYLRLALQAPSLIDDAPPHPALQALDALIGCWDANPRASAAEQAQHALADEVAQALIEDYHGDDALFARALERLERGLAPIRRRAEAAEKRTWQALQGRERLAAARRDADAQLGALFAAGPLRDGVADFLAGPWRQLLVQAWLREGAGSPGHADALALGEALVRLDAEAAAGAGAVVAGGLLRIEPRLRACCAAFGLEGEGAARRLAELVGELARPDAARAPGRAEPLAGGADAVPAADPGSAPALAIGTVLVRAADEGGMARLRLAWRSEASGLHLLTNPQGGRELLLDGAGLQAALDAGALRPRPPEGPVEAALRRLEREA